MNEGEFGEYRPTMTAASSAPREARLEKDIAISALLILIVSVPTMAIEENWHGHPMIDEPTHLWIIAACLVATAFVIGGGFAGASPPIRRGHGMPPSPRALLSPCWWVPQ